jgi:hypothetical protein
LWPQPSGYGKTLKLAAMPDCLPCLFYQKRGDFENGRQVDFGIYNRCLSLFWLDAGFFQVIPVVLPIQPTGSFCLQRRKRQ